MNIKQDKRNIMRDQYQDTAAFNAGERCKDIHGTPIVNQIACQIWYQHEYGNELNPLAVY